MTKVSGVLLLAVGVLLTVWGLNAMESFGSDWSRFFKGTPTDRSIVLLLGGVACGIAGLGLVAHRRLRGER